MIGVDNGVMPVEQMQVTITKPIEDAVNSVPGLSRSARIPAAALPKSASSSTGPWTCSNAATGRLSIEQSTAITAINGEAHDEPANLCNIPDSWLLAYFE